MSKAVLLSQLNDTMSALAAKIKAQGYEKKSNLKALAYKDSIEMSDLDTALQTEINNKADAATIQQQIDTQIGSVYKPGGAKPASFFATAPTAAQLGYVYNVTENFTTTADFLEGAGKAYTSGEDVGVVVADPTYTAVASPSAENPSEEGWYVENGGVYTVSTDTAVVSGTTYYTKTDNYKWNVFSGFIDQTQFASAADLAAAQTQLDGFEFATDPEIQAIIDGIDIDNGTVTPVPNGDNLGY